MRAIRKRVLTFSSPPYKDVERSAVIGRKFTKYRAIKQLSASDWLNLSVNWNAALWLVEGSGNNYHVTPTFISPFFVWFNPEKRARGGGNPLNLSECNIDMFKLISSLSLSHTLPLSLNMATLDQKRKIIFFFHKTTLLYDYNLFVRKSWKV